MKVKECMCNKTVTANKETTLRDIAKLMENNGIGSVPICDEESQVIGFITDRDIITRCVAANGDCSKIKASDVMTKQVIKTTPDTDIEEACETMSVNQIRRLPVIEQGKLVGMLSLGDISQNNDIPSDDIGKTFGCICNNKD